jgi:hypothetical protein
MPSMHVCGNQVCEWKVKSSIKQHAAYRQRYLFLQRKMKEKTFPGMKAKLQMSIRQHNNNLQ